jgi:hypothetical protein
MLSYRLAVQYQHYEEDEYERKRKRKLRESERKMFFYAGQGASGGASGDKSKRKTSSVDKGAGSNSTCNKKRRRKERERERERVLDKDSRRQLSGSAPLMMSMPLGSSLDSASSRSSSPFNSPPTAGLSAERAGSMPNMPWTAASDRTAFYSTSVPSGMPAHAAQDIHQMSSVQAASQLMRPRASMPQLPTQQQYHPRSHSSVGAYPLHHSASAHASHYSPSSSYDFMPQPSPLSSSSSSSSFASSGSSYHFTSPAPSPASHIVPIKATDYAPSPPTYHHPLHHHQPQPQHHQHHQQSYASYYQPQAQRYQQQQPLANSMPAEMLLEAYGGHFTAEEQPNDTPLDESWTSSSSISSSISSGGSGELSGSESFSCFGPFDPAALGSTVDGGDLEGLACADMASAAAAAVESFIFNQHQQPQHLKMESSPEGQHQAGADEDWFNSFFDCATVGSPLLGLGGGVGGNGPVEGADGGGAQCYPTIDSTHLDSLFADVESYYGRMVN